MDEKIDDEKNVTVVDDVELGVEFESEPRLYGGVVMSEDEMKVLRLPPKFGIYKKLNVTQCRIDVEESLNKLRWNRMFSNRDKNRTGVNEDVNGEFVSRTTNMVDIANLRPSDLPFNPNVAMPQALSMEEEVKLFNLKTEARKIAEDMAGRSKKWSNLTEEERNGLEKLHQRVSEKEIVCTVTDKSGRWSCDTLMNYKEGCEKLVEDGGKTPMITIEEHNEAEHEMNCHALALLRMLGLSDGAAGNRMRQAMTADGCQIAPLYGLRKDHKPMSDDVEERLRGPKMRPVCGARDSLTKRTSYILCKILTPLIEGETHCNATTDLKKCVNEVNKNEVNESWVVGSLDVDSLYPSLDIPKCVDVVKRRLMQSNIQFEKLQWKEIAMYLRFNMPLAEAESSNFAVYLPTRRFRRRPPLFTRSGSMLNPKVRHQPWIYPKEEPSGNVLREMICEAIGIMIKMTMKNHDYSLDGQIYRQAEGGAIGMDLTGVVADIYMIEWDQILVTKMQESSIGVRLYKRYKDDINVVLDVVDLELTYSSEKEREEKTMEHIKTLADGIDPALKVTVDFSKNHEDGRLPMLDISMWIGEDKNGRKKLLYTHYMKEVSSRATIHHRSSHSMSMKRNVLINETVRIINNCSKGLEESEVRNHISYLMKRMQFSEYPQEIRQGVVKEAIQKCRKKSHYGTGGETDSECRMNTKCSKQMWYLKKGDYESVMFVEATPESVYMRRIQQVVKKLKLKIKVVERAGTTIKSVLQKSNPFEMMDCGRDRCLLCCQGCGTNCRSRGCVYEYSCEECGRKYRGQTGRSIYERNKEHLEAWERREDDCPLQRHANLYHGGGHFVAELKVLAKCYGKPSRRLITESVYIDELTDDMTMNGKGEWSYVKLAKVQVHR